jgi:D-alanine-D-alanine ligase
VCPADLPDAVTAEAQRLAVRVHETLGCRDVSRVDLLCDDDGGLHVLEANVIPGMTDTSLLPQAADAAGLSFDGLIERLVERAVERGAV